jgi:hypothetical protein
LNFAAALQLRRNQPLVSFRWDGVRGGGFDGAGESYDMTVTFNCEEEKFGVFLIVSKLGFDLRTREIIGFVFLFWNNS